MLALASILLPMAWGVALAATSGDSATARRRLARHYYLSAVKYEADDRSAEAAELFRKAYETDTTYAEAAFEYGLRRYGMPYGRLASAEERERSKRIARKLVDLYPGDVFPSMLYANLLERANDLDEAVDVMENLRKYNPGNTDVLSILHRLYLDTNDIDSALETLDAAAAIDGEDEEYYVRRAGIQLALGDTLATLDEADRLIKKFPKSPAGMCFRARLQDYFNMPDSALVSFGKAEAMMPPESGGAVKIQFANFYLEHGDSVNYDAKTYDALLADDLDFATKRDLLAFYLQNLLDEKGDHARGDRLFDVLLEQYPHEAELRSLASRYSVAKHDYASAIEQIDYAIDLDQSKEQYWNQAMTYCLLDDQYERGFDYFERAVENIDDLGMDAYIIAGALGVMADDPQKALDVYSRTLSKFFPGQKIDSPIDRDALRHTLTVDNVDNLANLYQQIGDAYFKAGDPEHAYLNYENSLEINPDSPLTLNNYAYFLVVDGKTVDPEALQKADSLSERAVRLQPDQPTYLDTRAWVLFRKGDYKEAKEVQMRALELLNQTEDPGDQSEFYNHLGDILFMNHEPEEALKYWQKALETDPDNELLKKKVAHKTFFFE
ncbi:MAG: tetratricopeptide repeat protein [Muribaculaceae bacterium]|nr:tetratricopeptide repeat protein [Muribaculaceae bacterium]